MTSPLAIVLHGNFNDYRYAALHSSITVKELYIIAVAAKV